MKLRNAQGLLSSAVPTGNLVWVDPVNGNDALAVRGRLTIPFRTLTAAKNAAQPGDTIMVLPGIYNEKNLLKHQVNWHFMNGATVLYTGTDEGAIFDTSSYGTNGLVACSITGFGDFAVQNLKSSGHVLNTSANGSAIIIECRGMSSDSGSCARCAGANGSLHLVVRDDLDANGPAVISIEGDAEDNFIEARNIYSSTGHALYVSAGSLALKAHQIRSSADSAVAITSGSGHVLIDAYEIVSENSYGVLYSPTSSSTATLTIRGARIISLLEDAGGYAVYNASDTPDVIKLANCVLIVWSGADSSINSANPGVRVHFLNGVATNINISSYISPVGGTVSTDINIS